MTRDEMHIKALSKGVDSQKIKGSMTVVLLGHAVDMMMEMQDAHEAEIKHLTGLSEGYKCIIKQKEAELKAKDERIAELETMVKNMCAECECAKFADNAIKPSEMWKLHLMLKNNE